MPLYFGGASEVAHRIGARHADVYMLWGEPLAAVKQRIAEVRDAALPFGREPRFSVSLRPIIAPTEARAWDKARDILAKVQAKQGDRTLPNPEAVGAQRLVDFAREADVHDKRLWTPIAAAVGGSGNSTALVGTPEQVAESLLDYYELGVSTLLIRGFDPLADAVEYGRELIPLVRAEVARRDRDRAAPDERLREEALPPNRGPPTVRPSDEPRRQIPARDAGHERDRSSGATRLVAVVGSVTPPGRLNRAIELALEMARAKPGCRGDAREPRRLPDRLRRRPAARSARR